MHSTEVSPALTPTQPFDIALNRAAQVAALSPSSHNCQPWALAHLVGPEAHRAAAALLHEKTAGAHYLALALDREHQLSTLAAHGLEMLLSCGLYGQLLARALAAQSWALAQATFLPPEAPRLHSHWPDQWTALCVLKFVPGAQPAESITELSAAADARRTNRAPYRDEPLATAILDALVNAPGTALSENQDVSVRHLLSPEHRARFARLLSRHGGRDFSDLVAWRETHSYIRSSQDAGDRGDGFTLAQLFGPMRPARRRFLELALAPTTMRTLRHLGYPRLLAGQLAALARDTTAISILSLPAETPAASDVLRAGAYLADYWLRATRHGLALHPLSILLQHEDARRDLQMQFDLPGRVFFVARLGRPTMAFARTARRPSSAACLEL